MHLIGGAFLIVVGFLSVQWSNWGRDSRKFPVFLVGLLMLIIGFISIFTAQPLT